MNDDLTLITKRFPKTQNVLLVYAIGDVHVGSEQFDERSIKEKIKRIKADPCGVVCLCGDLADYGLKNSKTNVYKAIMQPREQQRYVYELFKPIADKIVTAVPGNHEERVTREVGTCPLYDLCVLWGVQDVYRENVAIVKYIFGQKSNGKRIVFVGVTTHGSTRNKHHKHMLFYNADFSISGHTHTPSYSPHGRIYIDSIKATAKLVPYKEIVVDANLKPGGYSIKHEYEIPPPPELQYLELSFRRKNDKNRTEEKVMDYHAIQI